MREERVTRNIALLLTVGICAGTLSGCRYSSFDEYLEALGIKDPPYEEVTDAATYEQTLVVSEDSITSSEEPVPAFQASKEDDYTYSTLDSSETVVFFDEAAEEDSEPEIGFDADRVFKSSYKELTESELNEEMKNARLSVGLTPENIEAMKKEQKGLYAFDRLTGLGQTLYVEILAIIQHQAENVMVSTTSDDAIDLVFDYVCADHPELFYVDGYKYTNYTIDNTITKIGFSGSYTYTPEEVSRKQTQINQAVNECLAGAPTSTDDYYAIKYVYEYLIQNVEYDLDAPDNQNICSVFIGKKSVCNGYSKAAQLLLNKLGIKCTLVTGTVDTKRARNVRHAWNLVLCNDAYYYVDVTWGDSSYQVGNGENADATRLPAVNYDYLNVTTDEIMRNHTISDEIYMPGCNSMKDNYYVREDEYFTSAELVLIGDLFNRRYQDGSSSVVIKCANKSVYDQLFEQLVTQRQVFDYLQGDNSTVSYTSFVDTNTLIFWIA
ncbi:transglutaminase domain-containing protein [Butyrivibrio sp. VCB2006]|uniref:transglutaminase domain-containing protein n=1 Tax=Butyrivibrio sp. VCB2006 TaxID=1280679 RepID=UPI00041B634D|nr:transglutaminase domain-containing protein [Butyrivibrio sp. VCB2006]